MLGHRKKYIVLIISEMNIIPSSGQEVEQTKKEIFGLTFLFSSSQPAYGLEAEFDS